MNGSYPFFWSCFSTHTSSEKTVRDAKQPKQLPLKAEASNGENGYLPLG